MNALDGTRLAQILASRKEEVLTAWIGQQLALSSRRGLTSDVEMRSQFSNFLDVFLNALATSDSLESDRDTWNPVRNYLADVSAQRARQGFTPGETATFVFSLKQPMFTQVRAAVTDPAELAAITWAISLLLDNFGLYTMEVYSRSREQIIARQQQELLELSTPVVQLWQDILALPLIGTLDSSRTQVVMESLLQKIVDTGASIAIIDITGVPTVDTLVAQHLLKTVAAARLMGADCIISGIRPQIAQTIVHLGVNLSNVITKATLADAFIVALKRLGKPLPSSAAAGDGSSSPDLL
ncbi:rsbT co-antagonist protein RsbR [Pararobbsia alpina]|uniref:STAS domain-containing protein n=1 Tax=Pararobbsia alpina TaxID=621374 RepID=UPI0039A74B72